VIAALLVGLTATAQTSHAGRAASRSVLLTGRAGESPLIYLAPGTFTFIILDAPIVRESVEVEDHARFARVDPGDQSITLALRAPLGPGERLALRFTYREGSPASVVLLLTGQPGEVDTVVHVSRPGQADEACRVELATTREQCEVLRKELEGLKARLPVLSPATVALAGFVGQDGMKGKLFVDVCSDKHGDLRPSGCRGLGGKTWSVVVLVVSNTGVEPWAPAWAEVVPAAGMEPRRARTVLTQQGAIPPGSSASVAVEVEMPARKLEAWLSALHTLRVCNEDGSRCLSVPKVNL
jgi:uncharacterized protein (TIGR02268 family)